TTTTRDRTTPQDTEARLQIPDRTGWRPCARCFASGAGQSLGVGIKSNHFDVRIKLLDQRGQSARAAAHVENALTRPQRRFLQQRPPGRVIAKQLHYRIVERQRPIVSSRREISSRRFHHGFNSCALVIPLAPLSCEAPRHRREPCFVHLSPSLRLVRLWVVV